MNSQELERFVNNDFRLVKRNLKSGRYAVTQAIGHLNCLMHLSEANSRRDLLSMLQEELAFLSSPEYAAGLQPVALDAPIMINKPDPLLLSEIQRLGGGELEHTYVVIHRHVVLGFFWGHIGEDEILLGPLGIPLNLASDEMFLDYIHTPIKDNGAGRRIVKAIFEQLGIRKIYAETNERNKGFWERLGADVDRDYSDDIREMYTFTLSKEQFFASILELVH
jgi:hypothetical protein